MSKSKTEYVTIPLDEYKELLLKDKPVSDNTNYERILDYIADRLEYSKKDSWSSDYMGDNMKYVAGDERLVKEILTMLKYTNFEKYMEIWNKVQTKHRNEEEMKLKIEQMNNAKEIRKEKKDNDWNKTNDR